MLCGRKWNEAFYSKPAPSTRRDAPAHYRSRLLRRSTNPGRASQNESPQNVSSSRGRRSRHPHRRNNAVRAKELQASYRSNKAKCIEQFLSSSPPPRCNIDKECLGDYFNAPPSLSSCNPPSWLPDHSSSAPLSAEIADITENEVRAQLRRAPSSSSPGPDRLPYKFWKMWPGSVPFLVSVFYACLLNNRIPDQWKSSTTILIYKKGDRSDPANWRPIALQYTIYKLMAAILARRLADHCISNSIISPLQKGFMPYEGCYEHSFLMRSIFNDSKRRHKILHIVFFVTKCFWLRTRPTSL